MLDTSTHHFYAYDDSFLRPPLIVTGICAHGVCLWLVLFYLFPVACSHFCFQSLSTIKFGMRAKKIKQVAMLNERDDDKTLLRKYRQEIERWAWGMGHSMFSLCSSVGQPCALTDTDTKQ